jgi:putative phosphoribosyl transferase
MIFEDRLDAGQQLAEVVKARGFDKPVVLGIPRGGVPIAAEVARAVDGHLAVVVARKLGAPGNPELAIGATTETGAAYINQAVAIAVGADAAYIEAERQRQVHEAHHREEMFNSHRRPPVQGRTVIVVDDGIATGATARAAIEALHRRGAASVTLAVPAAPASTVKEIAAETDEVVCLSQPSPFWSVGGCYEDFSQVSDEEVRSALAKAAARLASDGKHNSTGAAGRD